MESFAGILVAIIMALCSGLVVDASSLNGTGTSSGGSLLVTRPTEASINTPLAVNTNSGNVNMPNLANTSPYALISANVDGAKIPAQSTGQQEDLCDFMLGHSCNWFNLRRSRQYQARDIGSHPLTTDWAESTVAETQLPSSSKDDKLSTGTDGVFTQHKDDMGAVPSVDGAYGDHPPDTPSGGYWYPPNPTDQPTITPPPAVTTPIIVETRVQTVTVSLSYIPPSPLLTSPTPSSLVNSTLILHNTTVLKTSISSSSQTVTTMEYTPTPQTESVPTFIFTPGSSSFTFTRHTTWSFESFLHTVTPTPPPVVDTNSARTTAEVNYPLMCCMVAFVLFGSTTYVVRTSSRVDSAGNSANDLHVVKKNEREDHDDVCFVEGTDIEHPNAQAVSEDRCGFCQPHVQA
ncbi:hypothetical protein F4775DRAFT_603897 [Biscogniauxia sp. FL1348]|nr:hypothetical protein F4775DRAFT_603897 [Biscogniauxia sp. FL1348]